MQNRFSWLLVSGCLTALAIGGQLVFSRNYVAEAQMADIPQMSKRGDFNTAIMRGNRGYYGHNHWVVAPQTDTGMLNCRMTPNGHIQSRISQGAIIRSSFTGPVSLENSTRPNAAADAVVAHNGSPWLRITGTDRNFVAPPAGGSNNYLGDCYVRANSQYIIPVSNDVQFGTSGGR